jgi:photosystem II stability/assembly factor-like uncharacterized protein
MKIRIGVLSLIFAVVLMPLLSTFAAHPLPEKGKSPAASDTIPADILGGLRFRSVGPALTSGRISSIAVHPGEFATWYIAAASGGVWKTTNAGTTWSPIFDDQGSYSIGTVVLDPNNPLVVWVGSGENNSQRSVAYGDGVYKSEDGGKSWKNMGLRKSEHIARIVIDPRNSNVVFVAAQGPLWGPGGDRGLYKSTDAGTTWKAVLAIGENTGVSDLVMDPGNPDIMYASAYQRRRHVWTLIDGGPESAIYKSTDGGNTWNKLKGGLPGVDMGRIGLAVSPVDSRIVYATIEAAQKKGGFYRSLDYGASWEKRSDYVSSSPQYYSTIIADPKDPDRVYSMDVYLKVTDDGGKTFVNLGEKSKHVDNHAMWIDPKNTSHYIVGSDGGLYESFDRGQTWDYKSNLSITQFYDVAVDNSLPFYYIYGGTQDNFTLGGPSRTRNAHGITNADWFVTTGGDGFQSRVDPEDPNIVYSESQYGGLVRYDRRSGEELGIQPQPGKGEPGLRWNWDSPLIISPHMHTRLYFAANILYRSDDRGDTWRAVSRDLTRQIDRNTLEVMGKVWGIDAVAKNASTSLYGNCTALAESPLKEELLYVGTDDGLINISDDGGSTWRRTEKFPGVPERTYVTRIVPSWHDVNTVYASFDNHKNADFAPYLLKSIDAGKTWTAIKANLPSNGPVLAIAEDHVNPGLLFAGTEFGLFFTIDGGAKWLQLKSGLPTVAVRDIAIQKRENDLVLASFGRGFYVLDDYTPLRTLKAELLTQEAVLFPIKDALMYIQPTPLGGTRKAFQGESFFTAPNPPFGGTFTYYMKEALKSLKEKRQDMEKEADKKKQQAPYPTPAQLRAEDEEEAPSIIVTIRDGSGNIVRRFAGNNSKGLNRVTWDLRSPLPVLTSPPPPGSDDDPDGGPLVMPGQYTVTLSKRVGGIVTDIAGPAPFAVVVPGQGTMPPDERKQLVEFQQQASRLQRAVSGALQLAAELKSRVGTIKRAIQETPAPVDPLMTDATGIEGRLNDILRNLRGDNTLRSRSENSPLSISDRIGRVMDNTRTSTSKPPQTDRDACAIAGQELQVELERLKALVEIDFPKVEKAMEALGSPWTPGRLPEWKER